MDVKTDSHQKMHRGIRNSNIELFRIISMLVIVAHHYVANSGVINEIVGITEPQLKDYFLLIWGWGGKTGINCFVLITGYFMCKSQITAEKFIKLLAEVEFYNILQHYYLCRVLPDRIHDIRMESFFGWNHPVQIDLGWLYAVFPAVLSSDPVFEQAYFCPDGKGTPTAAGMVSDSLHIDPIAGWLDGFQLYHMVQCDLSCGSISPVVSQELV